MKKMDEMERNIQLRSEELGYKAVMLALCAWTLFQCWQTLANGARYMPLPGLILCAGTAIQGFSRLAMKQRMIAGDEEYKEPNRLVQMILAAVFLAVIILSLGTYFLLRV